MKSLLKAGGVMFLCFQLTFAQQQEGKTWTDVDGTAYSVSGNRGLSYKNQKGNVVQVFDAPALRKYCHALDGQTSLSPTDKAVRRPCDFWMELQPRTQIEKLPFSELIRRLLLISPRYTTFGRYRGIELESNADRTVYDATIVPSDIKEVSTCTVSDENKSSDGLEAAYQCSIKTGSYPAAAALKARLVSELSIQDLTEDQVGEHGFAASARNERRCAPSGECESSDVFMTAQSDGKRLIITAEPSFIRDPVAEIQAQLAGHHAAIQEIAADSGSVDITIASFKRK